MRAVLRDLAIHLHIRGHEPALGSALERSKLSESPILELQFRNPGTADLRVRKLP
jgi:hypothetical protein